MIGVYFQHMPPSPTAVSLRGSSFVEGLAALPADDLRGQIAVLTDTLAPAAICGVTISPLGVMDIPRYRAPLLRATAEARMGLRAARRMLFSTPDCELAVVSSPSFLSALMITNAARMRRTPYVLDVRDLYPQAYATAGLIHESAPTYRWLTRLSRRMYAGASIITTATQGIARAIAAQAVNTNVECIYNGYPASFRARFPRKHERFTVCSHGILGYMQDVPTLINVAHRLVEHNIDLVVIGYGHAERHLTAHKPSNLHFMGRLPFEDTIGQVERCHVGLCLRYDDAISRDAFPVRVWEYIGLRIPCIVTPHCEAGDFLSMHQCGLQRREGDVGGIVNAILSFKQSPEHLQETVARCEQVGYAFTREQSGRRFARLVSLVLKGLPLEENR